MNKEEVLVLEGTLFWAHLAQPSKTSGKYEVEIGNLSKTDALKLKGLKISTLKQDDSSEEGKPNKGIFVPARSKFKPTVVGPDKTEWDEEQVTKIGNGTLARVVVNPWSWNKAGKKGISLNLGAPGVKYSIQVLKLKEYNGNGGFDPFEAVEETEEPFDLDDVADLEIED